MHSVTAAVPVKPFDDAKRRLSEVLDAADRRSVSEQLAARTVRTIRAAGIDPLVLSADDGVTRWARHEGVEVLLDRGSSLDRAAATARDRILDRGGSWMIVHADLPLLTVDEVAAAARLLIDGRAVIAPSSDGGTSMIGAARRIGFSYGGGSFHRHLAALRWADPSVLISIGWALDLDTPTDLAAALRHPEGAWLSALRPASRTPPSAPV